MAKAGKTDQMHAKAIHKALAILEEAIHEAAADGLEIKLDFKDSMTFQRYKDKIIMVKTVKATITRLIVPEGL